LPFLPSILPCSHSACESRYVSQTASNRCESPSPPIRPRVLGSESRLAKVSRMSSVLECEDDGLFGPSSFNRGLEKPSVILRSRLVPCQASHPAGRFCFTVRRVKGLGEFGCNTSSRTPKLVESVVEDSAGHRGPPNLLIPWGAAEDDWIAAGLRQLLLG